MHQTARRASPNNSLPEDFSIVEEIHERAELRHFLMQDKLANAYLLGDLDPHVFQFCRWYGSRDASGNLGNLVLVYNGLSLPLVLMVGNEPDFPEFLEECRPVLPDRFHFHVLDEHIDTVREIFDIEEVLRMKRMGLRRQAYTSRPTDPRVRQLGHGDTGAIMRLYESYPDNLFEPSQLETGLYFGIDGEDGELLSIAGIHVVSEEYDVAVAGNLVTRPDARNQGLATACTGRLLDDLFEQVSLVALNVQQDNAPAIAMYKKFGFQPNNIFWEGRYLSEDEG